MSPETIGEEAPVPVRDAFQAMFFVGLHWVGKPVSAEIP
jgi:hypothetical protein